MSSTNRIPSAFRLITSFAFSLIVVSAGGKSLTGTTLEAALEGAWCNSEDGGSTCWGFDEFHKGVGHACARVPGTNFIFSAKSTYVVEGSRVCHRVREISSGAPFVIGERMCFDVLEIDGAHQTFRDVETGEVATILRIPQEQVRCPGVDV